MEQYIPLEIVLKLVDSLSVKEIDAFFSTNKELSNLANNPRVLRQISLNTHLPFVSSFVNLLYFDRMDIENLLINAAIIGDIRVVKYHSKYYQSKKVISAATAHFDILKYLIDKYGPVLSKKDRVKVLKSAIKNGNLDSIKYIGQKYKIKTSQYWLNNILENAIKSNDINIVEYVVKKYGLPIDIYSLYSPLNVAVKKGNMEIIMYLISAYGEDTSTIKKSLYIAINYNNKELVDYLLKKYGNDIDPLDILISAVNYNNIDMYEHILQKTGYHPDDRGIISLLKYAIEQESLDIFIHLLDKYRITPAYNSLMKWIKYSLGNRKLNMYIIKRFADKSNINDIYKLALDKGNITIMKYILEEFSDIITVNMDKSLIVTSEAGNLELVKYIREHYQVSDEAVKTSIKHLEEKLSKVMHYVDVYLYLQK